MSARVFVDSNVVVYTEDPREPAKRTAARRLFGTLVQRELGVLSVQVLSEFANVATADQKLAMAPEQAAHRVREFEELFEVLEVRPSTVAHALAAKARWTLSYYDAQLWATAALNAVPLVLSEDFQDGLVLGPVLFRDPFAEGFDLDASLAEAEALATL